MSDLRLHMFQCGSLKCKLHNIKMNQGLNDPYEIPVPWFLIKHPKGNVVIDGGNAVECGADPYAYWGSITDVDTLDHWNEKALPGFLASTVDTVRSVRKLHQVARQTGAMIVTGHDPDAWPKFKKTPQYYD